MPNQPNSANQPSFWPQDKNLTLWVGVGEFARKLVLNLVFGPRDPSHQVDLAEKIISVFLIPQIAPQTAPKPAGIILNQHPSHFGVCLRVNWGD